MSTGDDEPEEPAGDGADSTDDAESASLDDRLDAAAAALDADAVDEEALATALDEVESALDAAETEAALDEVAATLDEVESALEDADLPEPDDEDEAGPREELESRVGDLREGIEDERGPYAEDVVADLEAVAETIGDTRWTEDGADEIVDVVEAFVAAANDALDADLAAGGESPAELADAVEAAAGAVGDAGLDPDDDADTIAALVEAADDLAAGLDEAEEWDDLTVREQLAAEGFYEVLDHRKDFPPEWHAIKAWERRGRADMIVLAFEKLESDFMEEHCLEAFRRMGPEEVLDPMVERAERRDQPAIEILGKIGSEEPVDTLLEYVDEDADPKLQRVTMRALAEIGAEEATGAIATRLAAENERVRSRAARALGLLGDTRAIEPLADVLADDDSNDVRASAAWALVQIGTERALESAAAYTDDRAYTVQAEAENAAEALGADAQAA